MNKEKRLLQHAKDNALLLTIPIISVNTITPIIMRLERGFSKESYLDTLKIIPFMLMIVALLVRVVMGPLVAILSPTFVGMTDGRWF